MPRLLAEYDFIKKMRQRIGWSKSFDVFFVQKRKVGNVTTKSWQDMRKLILRGGLYHHGEAVKNVDFLRRQPYS